MKASELREKSEQELSKELLDLCREVFSLRMQMGSGQPVRYGRFKTIRRDVARIKTIINERKRAITV